MTDARDELDAQGEGWFSDWRASAPPVQVLTTAAILICLGSLAYLTPRIDGALSPIFEANDLMPNSVTREGQKLCWTRVGLKRRALPLEDVDAIVDYISNKTGKLAHQVSPALRDGESGDDLTSDDAVPAGVSFQRRICTVLSAHILPGQPVRLRQTAHYRSWTGLYNIPVEFPTIVLPADSAWVFSQRHDNSPTPSESGAVAGPPPRSQRPALDDPPDIVRSPDDDMRRQEVAPRPQPAPAPRPDAIPLGDLLRNDDGAVGSVHMDTTVSPEDAARIELSRQAHGDKSRRATLRRLIPRALGDEDRDALKPYDPDGR